MALLKDTITVTLQVAFDSAPSADLPTWTTVASNTTKRLRSWQIRRGRNSTLDTFQAGTASFVLDNRDRLFDPLYAAGTYFGKLKPGKRVRLQVTYNGTTYTRFDGYVDGWPQEYPSPSVKDALVELRATDGFKRLGRNRLDSVWRQEVLADTPRAWWRLGESSGTVANDSSGNGHHGTYEGGATFNSRTSLIQFDSDPSIEFDGVDDIVTVSSDALPTAAPYSIEFWITSEQTVTAHILQFGERFGATPLMGIDTNSSGTEILVSHFSSDSLADPYRQVGTNATLFDGQPHHVVAVLGGTAATSFLYVDGVDRTDVRNGVAGTIAFPSATVGWIGWDGWSTATFAGTLDEVAIYPSALSAARVAAHYDAGTTPWAGDTPAARIGKVLNADTVAWPASDRNLDTGSASLDAADLSGDGLSHLQAVALSEGGRFFMSRDGKATLIGRSEFWTETAYTASQGTFSDDGAGLPYTGFGWDYSDDKVRNEVRINPQSGSEQVAADVTSQAEYGPIGYSQTSLEQDITKVASQAAWLLSKFKDAAFEVDRLDIDPLRSPAVLFPVVLGAELGYRYTIERTPQGVGTQIAQEVHLEGTSEAGDSNSYRFSWLLSRAEPGVFIIGTSTIDGPARIGY